MLALSKQLCLFSWLSLTGSYIAHLPHGFNHFGMGLSTFGVVWIIAQGDLSRLLDFSMNIGDFYMVLAILTYGIFSVSLRAAPKLNQWSYLFVLFVIGAAELFPLQLYEYAQGARMQLTTGSVHCDLLYCDWPRIFGL